MTTSERPREVVGETLEKWGYKFKWTDEHMSHATMQPLRLQYDELGATALQRLQSIRDTQSADALTQGIDGPKKSGKDLYTLLRDNYQSDPILTKFWEETHHVPAWVDWAQLARGQEFFHRYIGANITGFALQGFVGENSVSYQCLLRLSEANQSSTPFSFRDRNPNRKTNPSLSFAGRHWCRRSPSPHRRLLNQSAPPSSLRNLSMAPPVHRLSPLHPTRWRRPRIHHPRSSSPRLCPATYHEADSLTPNLL